MAETTRPTTPLPPVSRRGFLFSFGLALNAAAAALFAVPVVGFLFSPARRLAQQAWVPLGPLASFPEGQTRLATYRNPFVQPWDGETANVPCWVRRIAGEKFQVFAINCAHLGCPVRWFPESGLFMCPCHGGVYYADGSRASGPPPRGLFEYAYKIEGGAALGARRRAADSLGAGVKLRCQSSVIGSSSAPGSARRSARPRPIAVPSTSASWWYVFGSATLVAFVLQVVTGICLATVYAPSANDAWTSLERARPRRFRSAGSCAPSTAGAPTSWSRWSSCTWFRCSSSAPTSTRASSPGWSASCCSS